MGRLLLEAEYDYSWRPLAGALSGQLRGLSLEHSAGTVAVVIGAALQVPPSPVGAVSDSPDLPPGLVHALRTMGAAAQVVERPPSLGRLQEMLLRRRIRRELGAGRAVVAFGAGVDPFGPTFGLIVGYDDERRAWRREGPMTEQVSPWLPQSAAAAALVFCRRQGDPDLGAMRSAAAAAQGRAVGPAAAALRRWAEVFDSDAEIDPQRHARSAQALASGWGEAAEFWRGVAGAPAAARDLALMLSRYATLFPYPMGGQPQSRGIRTAAAGILRRAAERLDAPG